MTIETNLKLIAASRGVLVIHAMCDRDPPFSKAIGLTDGDSRYANTVLQCRA